ncbi:MAG: PIN domain-containing protein [Sphingomonadaceae bacterium]|nr:PIN domain-containing protein [Sphingomonadaceae bacterium]
MPVLIDTDVAIHWRDGDPDVRARVLALGELPAISTISRVELENGVYRDPGEMRARRLRLDVILRSFKIVDFTRAEAVAYSEILAAAGYSKRKTNDRMIAATDLVHDLTLVTINGRDFRDVPDLKLEIWPGPAA